MIDNRTIEQMFLPAVADADNKRRFNRNGASLLQCTTMGFRASFAASVVEYPGISANLLIALFRAIDQPQFDLFGHRGNTAVANPIAQSNRIKTGERFLDDLAGWVRLVAPSATVKAYFIALRSVSCEQLRCGDWRRQLQFLLR